MFLTIIKFIAALPKILDAIREAYWTWEAARSEKRLKEGQKNNDEIHDEINNGGRPRWDNRK